MKKHQQKKKKKNLAKITICGMLVVYLANLGF
jgi:hypothetical protein